MGWANCGTDSKGRPIGYAHSATCDFPGCTEHIDRGLDFACGGMHGRDEHSCEGYFCYEHRPVFINEANGNICEGCATTLEGSGDWERVDGDELVKKS